MQLHPQWVSGFVDGEGTFYVGINSNLTMTIGYQVLPEFRVVQHERDVSLLYELKRFFKAGVVRNNHGDRFELRIRKLEVLQNTVIPFFETYPLQTKKRHDFQKFKEIVGLMRSNRHLEKDGLLNIIEIACQMNRADKQKTIKIKKKLLESEG